MMLLVTGIGLKIIFGLGIVLGIVWAYFGTLRRGAQDQRSADTRKAVQDAKVRSDVETETLAKPDASISDDLHRNWTRPDKRL